MRVTLGQTYLSSNALGLTLNGITPNMHATATVGSHNVRNAAVVLNSKAQQKCKHSSAMHMHGEPALTPFAPLISLSL